MCFTAGPAAAFAQGPAPVVITLPEAIQRAEASEPNYAAVRAAASAAGLDRGIARAGLLPGVVYHNQVLYTQPNGAINQAGPAGNQAAPIFIANNAVREYASLGVVTENLSLAQIAAVRLADSGAARTAAELEISRRGLVAAVAGLFYGILASQGRFATLQAARNEAEGFVVLTEKREAAREAAHADVLKAELTLQQRERDLGDAQLALDRARLELAVLLFPDPLTPFQIQAQPAPPLPSMADVEAAARSRNPELASALASLRESNAEVLSSEAAYLPGVSVNFTYGIDATTFATRARFDGTSNPRNLGYSLGATIDIPVWDWLATERRVKQSEIRRAAVRVALTAAQRRLVMTLQEGYAEAQTARDQLASLDATVRTAEESFRLAKLRYARGEALVLEVVDAQNSLYLAQTAQVDGEARYRQALSSLETLTGTL